MRPAERQLAHSAVWPCCSIASLEIEFQKVPIVGHQNVGLLPQHAPRCRGRYRFSSYGHICDREQQQTELIVPRQNDLLRIPNKASVARSQQATKGKSPGGSNCRSHPLTSVVRSFSACSFRRLSCRRKRGKEAWNKCSPPPNSLMFPRCAIGDGKPEASRMKIEYAWNMWIPASIFKTICFSQI